MTKSNIIVPVSFQNSIVLDQLDEGIGIMKALAQRMPKQQGLPTVDHFRSDRFETGAGVQIIEDVDVVVAVDRKKLGDDVAVVDAAPGRCSKVVNNQFFRFFLIIQGKNLFDGKAIVIV